MYLRFQGDQDFSLAFFSHVFSSLILFSNRGGKLHLSLYFYFYISLPSPKSLSLFYLFLENWILMVNLTFVSVKVFIYFNLGKDNCVVFKLLLLDIIVLLKSLYDIISSFKYCIYTTCSIIHCSYRLTFYISSLSEQLFM